MKQRPLLWREKKLPLLALLLGALIAAGGFLISYVICVDWMAEFMDGNRMYNEWVPVKANFLETLTALPHSLFVAFSKFPIASAMTLIFFPLLIVLLPLYQVSFFGDWSLFYMGWLPFFAGGGLFLLGGILREDDIFGADEEPPEID